MTLADIPAVNASLNGLSAVLLLYGFYHIRAGHKLAHRNCMIAAFISSSLFLGCYLYYHYQMQQQFGRAHTSFTDPAWFRPIYLTILFTHLLGAFVILPLIFTTFYRAIRGQFEQHKTIARVTLPIWLYVSFTGVLIYLLLYQVFPQRR